MIRRVRWFVDSVRVIEPLILGQRNVARDEGLQLDELSKREPAKDKKKKKGKGKGKGNVARDEGVQVDELSKREPAKDQKKKGKGKGKGKDKVAAAN